MRNRLTLLGLSDLDAEVISCLARGMKQKQVAEKLKISMKSVESHRMMAVIKTGLETTAQLFQLALAMRAVDLDPMVVKLISDAKTAQQEGMERYRRWCKTGFRFLPRNGNGSKK